MLALYSGSIKTDKDEDQTDVWFPAKVLGSDAAASDDDRTAARFEIEWDDDDEDATFVAGCHQLRTFLANTPFRMRPVVPKPKPLRLTSPGKQWGRGFREDGTVNATTGSAAPPSTSCPPPPNGT